jgi:hypothetical protein
MSGGDRKGPMGLGPRTGRGVGFCSGSSKPGYLNTEFSFGRRYGRSRGLGRGRGFWRRGDLVPYNNPQYYDIGMNPQTSKDTEKAYLEESVKNLEEEIKNMKNRIQELLKEKKE